MNSIKYYSYLTLLTFFLLGCENDSESDLSNSSLSTVTYTNTVKSIITENCIICHSQPPQNGAPMALTTYNLVKDAVLTRGLIDRISSNDPDFSMPFGGTRLPQSKIDQIVAWKNANYPE